MQVQVPPPITRRDQPRRGWFTPPANHGLLAQRDEPNRPLYIFLLVYDSAVGTIYRYICILILHLYPPPRPFPALRFPTLGSPRFGKTGPLFATLVRIVRSLAPDVHRHWRRRNDR